MMLLRAHLILSLGFSVAGARELVLLGDLSDDGRVSSAGYGISSDGSAVCGSTSVTLDRGMETEETVTAATIWTETDGLVVLPFPQNEVGRRRATARAISDDGSRIVGEARNFFNKDEAALWTRQADGSYQIQLLSPPQGGSFRSFASANLDAIGISGDGLVVCGRGQTIPGEFEAWRWTASTGIVPIGNLSNGPLDKANRTSYSSAEAVNRDGSIIGGFSWYALSDSGGVLRQGFRYSDGIMTATGDLQDPPKASYVYGISKDGTTIVGEARDSENGQVAYRKVGDLPFENLGQLSGENPVSIARAVSADGTVVVGSSRTDRGTEAFIWTVAEGMQPLSDLVNLDDGWLEDANAISDDGGTITGTVIYPNPNNQNEREAFVLKINRDKTSVIDQIDFELIVNRDRVFLSFTRPDLTMIYALEFSPDLASPFVEQVRFSGEGRQVTNQSYSGEAVGQGIIKEALLGRTLGFWRVRVSSP